MTIREVERVQQRETERERERLQVGESGRQKEIKVNGEEVT